MSKRISPREIVEAFKTTGLKAGREKYFPEVGCACGLGAIYAMNFGIEKGADEVPSNIRIAENLETIGYSLNFISGFARGFDGLEINNTNADTIQGYKDGQEAWKAVVEANLVKEGV